MNFLCDHCKGLPHWDWCVTCTATWDELVAECTREREAKDIEQAWDLIKAGWRFFPVTEDSQVMSWYWRRPPRRKGSKGMLFLSTNQAWMALQRQTPKL